MRILATADTVGGVWTYAMQWAYALSAHGVAIGLATKGAPPTQAQRQEALAIPGLTLFESSFRLEWMPEPWDDVARCSQWLMEVARRFRPDLIHLNDYAHGGLPWGAPVVVVGHSCVLSWWEAVRGGSLPPEWAVYRSEVGRGLSAAQAVVAPSAAMAEALQRHYGPLGQVRVIHNGLSTPARLPGPKEELVLSAGRLWDEAKNIGALEAVAPLLPWPLYLAGQSVGPRGEQTPAPPGSHRLGRLSSQELWGWYSRAAIYALPARYEPFGLSVLEAARAGCALVLGDIPSLRELWEGAALFVPPEEPRAIARALRRLIDSPRTRQVLSARSTRRAERFRPESMATHYAGLYRELLGQRSLEAPA